MSVKNRRLIWYLVWVLLLLMGPITVLGNTSLREAVANRLIFINFLQRNFGLLAYILLFIQIILGSFLGRWVQIIGAKAYRIHTLQGVLAYGFILLHPLMQIFLDYEIAGIVGALRTLLPGENLYLNLGRIALTFLTVAVAVGFFRTKPIFRRIWKKLHVLNYVTFIIIFVHSRNLGTDFRSLPFSVLAPIAFFSVILIIVYRLVFWIKSRPLFLAKLSVNK